MSAVQLLILSGTLIGVTVVLLRLIRADFRADSGARPDPPPARHINEEILAMAQRGSEGTSNAHFGDAYGDEGGSREAKPGRTPRARAEADDAHAAQRERDRTPE